MGERAYYASKLSDNIGRTPEGFLICHNVVLARTGWQDYEIRELPADVVGSLGIDARDGGSTVAVYRDPSEVFRAATVASCEGKSITDNHPPGEQFVTPANVRDLEYGHVANVRRGNEPLDSGEEALVGDLIIKREPLLSEIESGQKRELSCGYDYDLTVDGKKLVQRNIVINHVAVVPRGRAGAEARIKDAAPESQVRSSEAGSSSTGNRKETGKVTNILRHLLGLGLKAYAADADPEKLAEAAEAVKAKTAEKDEAPPEPKPKPAEEKPAVVAAEKPKAEDLHADEYRGRMHAALDCMLNRRAKSAEDKSAAEDVDLDELADLFDQFFEEESDEPEHQGEGEVEAGEGGPEIAEDMEGFENASGFHPIRGSEGYKRGAAGEGRKKRRRAADQFIEPVSEDLEGVSVATDTLEILRRVLRPAVARSRDANVRRAYNAVSEALNPTRTSRINNGGTYAAVAAAGTRRAADARSGDANADRNQRLQEIYDRQSAGERVEVKK